MDGFVQYRRKTPYIDRAPVVRQQRRVVSSRPAIDTVRAVPVQVHTPAVRQPPQKMKPHIVQPVHSIPPNVRERSHEVSPVKTQKPSAMIVHETPHAAESEVIAKLPKRSILRSKKIRLYATYGVAVGIVIAGGIVAIQGALLNNQLKEQVQVLSASTKAEDPVDPTTQSTEQATASGIPSEAKPATNYLEAYKVAADVPRILSIPSLNIKARVLQVGVDGNNELLTPKSIYDTAWYTGSVKPGEPGTAIIDGHYVGPTTKGVFSRINSLKGGDVVVVERGDGQKFTFRVTGVETIPVEQMDMMKILAPNDKQSSKLNLITCGGSYDAKTFHFSHRTIVYAALED